MRARVIVVHGEGRAVATLANALRAHGFSVCGAARSAPEALALARRERPDIALVELELPDGRGEELVAELHRALPRVATVALTGVADPARVVAAARAGVAGYLVSPISPAQLAEALRHVLAGDAPLSSRPAKALLDELRRKAIPHRSWRGLSPRELAVLAGIARGRTGDEIAAALGIGRGTVQTYVARIFEKLAVTTRVEAVRRATELHLIDADRRREKHPAGGEVGASPPASPRRVA